jgi:hypothetical protein
MTFMRNGMQNRTFQELPDELLSRIASYLDCNDMARLHETSSTMQEIVNQTPTSSVRFFDKVTSASENYTTQGNYENVCSRLNERCRIMRKDLEIEKRGVTKAPVGGLDMGGQPNESVNPEKRDYVTYGIMLFMLIGYAFELVVDNKNPTESSYTGPFLLLELGVLLFNIRDNGNRYDKLWTEKQQLNAQLNKINDEFPPKLRP